MPRIHNTERKLVEGYRLGLISLQELWAKLPPDRSFFVCLHYRIPWDARAILGDVLPELEPPTSIVKKQPRDEKGRWVKISTH